MSSFKPKHSALPETQIDLDLPKFDVSISEIEDQVDRLIGKLTCIQKRIASYEEKIVALEAGTSRQQMLAEIFRRIVRELKECLA